MSSPSKEPRSVESVLSKFSKSFLMELLATFARIEIESVKRTFSNNDKNTVVRALITKHNSVITSFVLNLEELRSCSLNSLKELLTEERGVSLPSVEAIKSKKDWLLFVYQNSLQQKIKSFMVKAQLSPTSTLKEYVIKGKLKQFTADYLQKNILHGIEKFNGNSLRKFCWSSPPSFAQIGKSYVFNIPIWVEGKEQRARCFRFRQEDGVPQQKKFELIPLLFNAVGKKEISVITKDGDHHLSTNLDLGRDSLILEVILKTMFVDGYSIEAVKYASVNSLVKSSMKTASADPAKAMKSMIDSFETLKTERIKEITENKQIPEEKKNALTEVINNITIGGVGAGNTPEFSVENFDYTFTDVKNAMRIPGAREMAASLLSISDNYVLKFNYKSNKINLENGQLKPEKRLLPSEHEALKILFGEGLK